MAEDGQTLSISNAVLHQCRHHWTSAAALCRNQRGHAALNRQPQAKRKPRRLDGEQEAHLIARCLAAMPLMVVGGGPARLLAEQMVELDYVESVSHETIRQTLKKMND